MEILVPLLFLLQSQTLNTTYLELPSLENMLKLLILKTCFSHLTLHTNLVLTPSLLQLIKKKIIQIFHIYIYTINVKNKIYFKPNASQIIHFPIQPTLPLTFETSDNEIIFPSTPHPFFNTRFNSTFNFLQVYQNVNTEPSSCSVIIQNITHHSATLTPGYIGYIEVPATNIQPSHYKVNDVNSLIHTVFHSYYPDLSEPKLPRRRSSLRNPHVEINNLQPSKILTRPLPPLPYSPDTQQFPNKFKFQYSDVSDEEYLQLCSTLVKYRTCYATHKNDVGQIATPFRIRLKSNAKLQTQRPNEVLFILEKN